MGAGHATLCIAVDSTQKPVEVSILKSRDHSLMSIVAVLGQISLEALLRSACRCLGDHSEQAVRAHIPPQNRSGGQRCRHHPTCWLEGHPLAACRGSWPGCDLKGAAKRQDSVHGRKPARWQPPTSPCWAYAGCFDAICYRL